jgi:hypothetical protein
MFKPALGIRKVERDVPSSRRGRFSLRSWPVEFRSSGGCQVAAMRFPCTAGRLATGVLPT